MKSEDESVYEEAETDSIHMPTCSWDRGSNPIGDKNQETHTHHWYRARLLEDKSVNKSANFRPSYLQFICLCEGYRWNINVGGVRGFEVGRFRCRFRWRRAIDMWLLLSCNNCSKVQEQVQTGRDVGRRCDGSNETLPAIIGAGLVKTGKKKKKQFLTVSTQRVKRWSVLSFDHPLTSKLRRSGWDRRFLCNMALKGVGSGTLVGWCWWDLLILRSYRLRHVWVSKQLKLSLKQLAILILLVLIYLNLIPVSKFMVFFNVVAYFDCIPAFWIKKRFGPSSNRFWTWTEPPRTWTESSVQGSALCPNWTFGSVRGSEKSRPEPDWTELRQPYIRLPLSFSLPGRTRDWYWNY